MSATTDDLDRLSDAVLWMLPRFQESGDVVAAVTEALEICVAETLEAVSLPIVTATVRLAQGHPIQGVMTELVGDVAGRVGQLGMAVLLFAWALVQASPGGLDRAPELIRDMKRVLEGTQ